MKTLLGLGFLIATAAAGQDEKLIGGRPADPKDFPASVYASMGKSRCSATVVGERVLYIAAHCVSNGGVASFSVGANRYSSRCTHTSLYKGNKTADWALCLTDKPVTGIPFEVVNKDASIHKIGQEVLLTGYGCIKAGGSGGNDGVYRIGESTITNLPSGSSNDIITKKGGALCYGDSGGPAFLYLDTEKTKRVMISVNSRGNIRDTSYLSSTSTSSAVNFATEWATKNNVRICGIHEDAQGCRDAKPLPELPEACKVAKAQLKVYEQCLVGFPQPEISTCETAQDALRACYEARH